MGLPVASSDAYFYHASGDCLLSTLPLLLLHALLYASAARCCMPLCAIANAATVAYVPTATTIVVSTTAAFC
jgi:hypothetical protein